MNNILPTFLPIIYSYPESKSLLTHLYEISQILMFFATCVAGGFAYKSWKEQKVANDNYKEAEETRKREILEKFML